MPWSIEVSQRARRDLAALDAATRRAVGQALNRLATDPSGADLKKLSGGDWRLRVGEWRVMLELDNRTGRIIVQRVVNRRDAYR
jgi:mRNA interferase RelE/StbE